MRAYEQLKAWKKIVVSSDDKEELTRRITVSSASIHGTSKTGGGSRPSTLGGFLKLEQERT